jgi:hypothetical protein
VNQRRLELWHGGAWQRLDDDVHFHLVVLDVGQDKRFADCCATSKPFSYLLRVLQQLRSRCGFGAVFCMLRQVLVEVEAPPARDLIVDGRAEPHYEPVMKALLDTDWAAVGRGNRRAGNNVLYFARRRAASGAGMALAQGVPVLL